MPDYIHQLAEQIAELNARIDAAAREREADQRECRDRDLRAAVLREAQPRVADVMLAPLTAYWLAAGIVHHDGTSPKFRSDGISWPLAEGIRQWIQTDAARPYRRRAEPEPAPTSAPQPAPAPAPQSLDAYLGSPPPDGDAWVHLADDLAAMQPLPAGKSWVDTAQNRNSREDACLRAALAADPTLGTL
jgi:hypothetical protein